MVAGQGPAAAGSYSESIVDRVRTESRRMFWRRLVVWGGMVALASGVAVLSLVGTRASSQAVLASTCILGFCAGFGATIFCFTRFVLTREFRYLLAAAAFSTLGSGFAAQGVLDFRGVSPATCGWIIGAAWLIASILFIGSAYAESSWRSANRRQAVFQFGLAAITVVAFPLAAVPYALDAGILRSLSPQAGGALLAGIIELVGGALAPAFTLAALIGYCRRFQRDDDRVAGLFCYFFVVCMLGLLAGALSGSRFDGWWTLSQIMFSAAWLVLIGGIAVENAFAQKEVSDRIEELEALHQVSWALVGAGNVRELLNLFALTLKERLGANVATVYLADLANEELQVSAVSGPEDCPDDVGSSYKLVSEGPRPGFHTGHTAKAFHSKEVQIASDVFIDVEFVPWRTIAVDNGCAVSLPLVDRGEAMGVLNLYFSDYRQLTRQRITLLATIAAAATPAIVNARSREAEFWIRGQDMGLAA